jgi:hypothetical protein
MAGPGENLKPREIVASVSKALGLSAPKRLSVKPTRPGQGPKASMSDIQLSSLEAHAVKVLVSYQMLAQYRALRNNLPVGPGPPAYRYSIRQRGIVYRRYVVLPDVNITTTTLMNDAANVLAALSTIRGRVPIGTVPIIDRRNRWNHAVDSGVLTPPLVYLIDTYLNVANDVAPVLTALIDQIRASFTVVAVDQRPEFLRLLNKLCLVNTVALPNRLSLTYSAMPTAGSPLSQILTDQGVRWHQHSNQIVLRRGEIPIMVVSIQYDLARYLRGMPVILMFGQPPLPVAQRDTMRV